MEAGARPLVRWRGRRSMARVGVVALVCGSATWLSASLAGGYVGTPAAVRLAQMVLASYGSVPALKSVSSGGAYYCVHNRRVSSYIGPKPPRYCRRAVETSEIDLSNGLSQRVVSQLTAAGLPTLTILADSTGAYLTAAGGRCWQQVRKTGASAQPPFHFDPKERLSIVGRRGGLILLRGTEGPGSELDSIDPQTYHVVAIAERARLRGGQVFRRTLRFTELSQATPPPTPTPLC